MHDLIDPKHLSFQLDCSPSCASDLDDEPRQSHRRPSRGRLRRLHWYDFSAFLETDHKINGTGYTTFAPELQKQKAEREGHPDPTLPSDTIDLGSAKTAGPTVISNDGSIGASVKEAVQEAKESTKGVKESVQESRQGAKTGTSWSGLSMFKWSYGGASVSEADDTSNDKANLGSTPPATQEKP